MDVHLLGPVEVHANGGTIALGGPKPRALIAMLALDPGASLSPEHLIDGLWGDDPPPTAAKLVQVYVSRLRKALAEYDEDEVIVTHGRGYALRLDRQQVDAARFERLLAQGAARDALALWRGDPLADVAHEPFAPAEIRRLEELRTAACEMAIDQDLEAGRHREVLPELEALLAKEPLRERLHAQRMLALYRAGRQADALEAYRHARSLLVEEIGVEPGPELRRLHEAILRQDPELGGVPAQEPAAWEREQARERLGDAATRASAGRADWQLAGDDVAAGVVELQALREREALAAAEPQTSSPFKGLASFGLEDAAVFFGRERLVADLVARVPGTRMMGIVGPSGSGKSSALRAGLLAAVADGVLPGSERWHQRVVRPGEHPVAALEQALSDLPARERRVIAVDQFEELFTACRDEQERAAFADALVACARDPRRPTLVLVAVRADFYGRCAAYPELSRMLGANHVLVGPMDPHELRRAIELPARYAGAGVAPALTDALIADTADEPGGLPLLSTALQELWDGRDDGRLELAAYERTGGVRGAVARLAEAAYAKLDEDERAQAKRILLRLAGEGDVRQRVPIADLDEARDVLSSLARDRLVTIGAGEAEVAHEALLREWPRLRGWLEEDAEGRRMHRHLTHAARDWDGAGRDPSELYRGSRLAAALEWSAAHEPELNALEREFLDAGRAAAESAAERDRRINRRLRVLLAGAGALLLVAVAAGIVALSQRGEARDAAVVADAQRLGAEALTTERLDQAMLLARAGVALDDSRATQGSLLSVLLREPAALGELRGDGWPLYSVAASADGRLVAIGDERGGVTVYDARTRERLSTPYRIPEELVVQQLAFSPDGTTLALTMYRPSGKPATFVDLIDPRTGERRRHIEVPAFPDPTFFVLALIVFSPDGQELVVQQSAVEFPDGGPSVLRRIDLRTGAVREPSLRVGEHAAWNLTATADGRSLFVTSAADDETYEIDRATLRVRRTHPVGARTGAVSPDGRRFALASEEGTVRMLDLRSGQVRRMRGGRHDDGSDLRAAFAPDGRSLVTSDGAGDVLVWDVERARLRERFSAHAAGTPALAISPDGRTLYTAAEDARMVLWDLGGDRRLDRRFDAGPPMVLDDQSPKGAAMAPDGSTLAVTQGDGSVTLIDTGTLTARRSVDVLDGAALAVEFSPDGELLAVTGEGSIVTLLDARTLRPVREHSELEDFTYSQELTFSPDGRLLAAAGFTGTPQGGRGLVHLWDVATGEPQGTAVEFATASIDFSPDGRLLALAGMERDTQIRDVRTGRLLARLRTGDFVRSVAFSPDGELLAVGHYGGTALLLSTDDWRPAGRSLDGHEARVTVLEFSPDGRRLMTGGAEGAVRLWDVDSRRSIGSALTVEPDAYLAAHFSRNGSHVYAVPHTGRAVRWEVRPEAWERHACLVAGRELTRIEWEDAVPEQPFQPICAGS